MSYTNLSDTLGLHPTLQQLQLMHFYGDHRQHKMFAVEQSKKLKWTDNFSSSKKYGPEQDSTAASTVDWSTQHGQLVNSVLFAAAADFWWSKQRHVNIISRHWLPPSQVNHDLLSSLFSDCASPREHCQCWHQQSGMALTIRSLKDVLFVQLLGSCSAC